MHDAHAMAIEAGWGGGTQAPFGASWQKTMMWIFIVTDALLFSGLLCGYAFMRMAGSKPWPTSSEIFSIPFIAFMTFVLITSSATMGSAVGASKLGDRKATVRYIALTVVGGLIFLGCQAYEWSHFIHQGARLTGAAPGSELLALGVPHQFPSSFFLLTGFHGSHVFSGLVILIITLIRSAMGKTPAQGVEMAGLYWHFVDLVWVFIFTLFYLL